jgi:hypothetical protein
VRRRKRSTLAAGWSSLVGGGGSSSSDGFDDSVKYHACLPLREVAAGELLLDVIKVLHTLTPPLSPCAPKFTRHGRAATARVARTTPPAPYPSSSQRHCPPPPSPCTRKPPLPPPPPLPAPSELRWSGGRLQGTRAVLLPPVLPPSARPAAASPARVSTRVSTVRRCGRQLEHILQALAQSKADDMRGLCVTCASGSAAATPSSDQTASESAAATPAPHAAHDAGRNVAAAPPDDSSTPTPPSPPSLSPAALSVAPYDMYGASPATNGSLPDAILVSQVLPAVTCYFCLWRLLPMRALTRLAVSFAPNALFSTTLWREILKWALCFL